MEVTLSGAHLEAERDHAARARADRRHTPPLHRGVENDAGVGAALVAPDELNDTATADLLLTVARDADVHGQPAVGGEQLRALEKRPELALVVCDAARVQPTVADGRLERLAVPQLERSRRLHVEVPVDEDRRRRAVSGRSANLAERERLRIGLEELRVAARSSDEVPYPCRRVPHVRILHGVRTDARNPQKLKKLVEPSLFHGGAVYALRLAGSRASPGCSLTTAEAARSTANCTRAQRACKVFVCTKSLMRLRARSAHLRARAASSTSGSRS